MRSTWLIIAVAIAAIPSAHAASKRLGTWQVDVSASNWGTDPAPQSMTLTVYEDTPERFGYRVHRVSRDGSSDDFEWRGTKDGKPYPVHSSDTSSQGGSAANKEVGGVLVEHGIEADGELEDATLSLAQDGRVMILDVIWTNFDKTLNREKWVWRKKE